MVHERPSMLLLLIMNQECCSSSLRDLRRPEMMHSRAETTKVKSLLDIIFIVYLYQ